jgi:2-methylaconitate cis-trans-isomerase PrpF
LLPGSVAGDIAHSPAGGRTILSIEHPSGEISVDLDVVMDGDTLVIRKSGTLRTARLISRGEVYIPAGIWP